MNTVWKLLEDLRKKKGVTEVIINSPEYVFIERDGELIRLNVEIKPQDIFSFTQEIAHKAGKDFSAANPLIDDVIDDGSRINLVHESYTEGYPAITIRKYIQDITNLDHLDGKFLISEKWIKLLKSIVASKANVIVSGGTSSGKTTMLNLLLQEIHPTHRVVTIEDTRELNFNIPNRVSLISSPYFKEVKKSLDTQSLVKNTLRMRPDRIILGEVRGAEAFDLLQAMNTGHDGSMCSVHANSPVECLKRLENLYLLSGHHVPTKSIREQLASAIDYIVHLGRNSENERCITNIVSLEGMEGETILTQDIGKFGSFGLEFTGLVPKNVNKLFKAGLQPNFFTDL